MMQKQLRPTCWLTVLALVVGTNTVSYAEVNGMVQERAPWVSTVGHALLFGLEGGGGLVLGGLIEFLLRLFRRHELVDHAIRPA